MTETAEAERTNGATEQACPDCGAALPAEKRFVVWCTECDWNVDPGRADRCAGHGRIASLRRRLARQYGEQLLAEVSAGTELRPHRDPSSLLARLVASVVHALTAGLVVGALWLIIGGWSTVVQPVVGALLLAIAFTLRPRFGRPPTDVPVLRRADAPRLFELLDEVAREAGTTGVDVVLVGPEANAWVTTYGIRQRRILHIGLGLWEILSPQERVALLGHEFGHYAHGDTRHSLLVGSALRTLTTWEYLLAPSAADALAQTFTNVVLAPARWTVQGLITALDHLTLRASQRAEYLADGTAARTGGTEAAVGLTDRLLIADGAEDALRRESVAAGTRIGDSRRSDAAEGLWERLAARMGSVPERELERLRRVGERRGHSVDDTHPPTHLRHRRLADGERFTARVLLDPSASAAVDAELAKVRLRLAREVIASAYDV